MPERLIRIGVQCLWHSVKYEDVYHKGYAQRKELLIRLTQ